MKKTLVLLLKLILGLLILFIIYFVTTLILGTLNDFKPDEIIQLEIEGEAGEAVIGDSIITLANWNVGYGGLGAESNFFFDSGGFLTDKGKMVRAKKEWVLKNIEGALDFIKANKVDFYLFQEVDKDSKRSYYINQHEKYQELLPGYSSTFSINYKANRVPLPVLQPWKVMGKMRSGLGTYSRFKPSTATRYQFPGNYGWPTRIFQLDRCMSYQRYKTASGNDLIIINTHNSAYDDGSIKKQQMDFLRDFLLKEYENGSYIIVGGDWNQCPPGFEFDSLMKGGGGKGYSQVNIAADYLPDGWRWVYDPKVPTNRKCADTYQKGSTFITVIDFYLVSPNVEVVEVRGVDQDFQFSDHQPVLMTARLK